MTLALFWFLYVVTRRQDPEAENLPVPNPAPWEGGFSREQAKLHPAPSLLLNLPPAPSTGHGALGFFTTHRVSGVVWERGVCVRDGKPAFLMRSLFFELLPRVPWSEQAAGMPWSGVCL